MTASDVRAPQPPGQAADGSQEPGFRYAAVLLIVSVLLVFVIVAPDADWARAVAVGLEAAALTIAVGTSRAGKADRRRRAGWLAALAIAVCGIIAVGVLPPAPSLMLAGLLAASIPVALAGGLVRLIRTRGATPQAVAGALAIYVLVGLLFAWIIGFISRVDSAPYFVQGAVSSGTRVYYSFAVLTTTGFGDYTSATGVGHALAVLEMLIGQLYLVTVIGILVGHLAGRATRPSPGQGDAPLPDDTEDRPMVTA